MGDRETKETGEQETVRLLHAAAEEERLNGGLTAPKSNYPPNSQNNANIQSAGFGKTRNGMGQPI